MVIKVCTLTTRISKAYYCLNYKLIDSLTAVVDARSRAFDADYLQPTRTIWCWSFIEGIHMTLQRKHLTTLLISTLAAGFVLAQAPGGNMMGGTNNNMMGGTQGSQAMAGQMMNPEMMRGLSGTMTQMHQMMQQMAGTMKDHGHGMGPKSMADMSKMMDDMGGMMQNMAAGMRDGKMDHAMFKTMNEQMDAMGKSMKHMKPTN